MGLFLTYNGEENGRIGGLRRSFHHLFSVVVLGDMMIGPDTSLNVARGTYLGCL
jgi:hypothetical protein